MIVDRSEQNWTPLAGLAGIAGIVNSLGSLGSLGDCYDATKGDPSPWRYVLWVEKDSGGNWNHYGANNELLMVTDARGYITVKSSNLPADMLAEIACVNANQANADSTRGPIPGAIAPGSVPRDYAVPTISNSIPVNTLLTPGSVFGGGATILQTQQFPPEGQPRYATDPFGSTLNASVPFTLPSVLTDTHFGIPTWMLIGGGLIGLPLVMSLLGGRGR